MDIELSPDIEEVKPFRKMVGFDFGKTYRYNHKGKRFYYCEKDDTIHLLPSVTTILTAAMKTPGLEFLMRAKGEEYSEFMNERAEYGTFLHMLLVEYIEGGNSLEVWQIRLKAIDFFGIVKTLKYLDSIVKDMLCINQFFIEKIVHIIAVELPIYNDEYAGTIDLVCLYKHEEKGFFGEKTLKGEPKKSNKTTYKIAIIDFKSGKSGFFDTHLVQLAAYNSLLVQAFENSPDANRGVFFKILETAVHLDSIRDMIDFSRVLCINFAPVDFDETPSFKEKIWSVVEIDFAQTRFEMYKELHDMTATEPKKLVLPAIIDKDSTTKLLTISEYLKTKLTEREN